MELTDKVYRFHSERDVLARYLIQLGKILQSTEQQLEEHSLEESVILDAAVDDHALSFALHVSACAQFARRAVFKLANKRVPDFRGDFNSIRCLQSHLELVSAEISQLGESDEVSTIELVRDSAGQHEIELGPEQYIKQFCLPNFFFHFVSAYTLLRSKGVQLSKADFDGLHFYQEGFHF